MYAILDWKNDGRGWGGGVSTAEAQDIGSFMISPRVRTMGGYMLWLNGEQIDLFRTIQDAKDFAEQDTAKRWHGRKSKQANDG